VARRPAAQALLAGAACVVAAAVAPGQPSDPALGERVFQEHCAVCHGAAGDGAGMAAHHFTHRPRDLTKGRFKFRSTASGQVPTDGDLRRTITRGVPGTGMVPQDHLSPVELEAVVAFVKSLSPRFAAGPPKTLAIPPRPPLTPETLTRGRAAYEKGACAVCHGRDARGGGPSAKDLSITPTDLTARPLKGGPDVRDIMRTLLTGLDGAPMPSYHQVLEDDELWDLAYYVDSLGGPSETTADERAGWHVVRMHQRRAR
jgi:mono/diheme cytochrome c family protein